MAKKTKAPDRIRQLYHLADNWTRRQWERVNQQGFEFAHDEQLSLEEKATLEEQGMPTFTINRILPVVEMLNFYATANNPRWQAIGAEGSDIDVAAVFSDMADYIWDISNGASLYNNAINDCITKSIGYLLVTVDKDADNGMGEVVVQQPEPFDLYVDPKCRDLLFKDAAYIMIRKVLPKDHLIKLYPDFKNKILKSSSDQQQQKSYTTRALGDDDQKFFVYNDPTEQSGMGITADGEQDELAEFFEVYEKQKVRYVNFFFKIPPNEEELKQMQIQCQEMMKSQKEEMSVQLLEQQQKMEQAVQSGEMLPERFELEMKKAQEMMQQQLQSLERECMAQIQQASQKTGNEIIEEKQFKQALKEPQFKEMLLDAIPFYDTRIKITTVVGDQLLYEDVLPKTIVNYPIIPFHFKWTGTPHPLSAVAPLIGKQQEINKAHQIMVHNASLGSSLRWMYEEGSIDEEQWEKYSSSPGALLSVRPGSTPPTPVQPAALSSAFFGIVQEAKGDMEYLAGIYSSMMGDTGGQHDTYRGMLAMDEYGTRRIKQWMSTSIEPALMQVGKVILEYCQAVYSAQKRFRIIQPSALQEERQAEINIPMYNDMGEAIGKSMDITAHKFDIRIVQGSTLPINRWAYLEELKSLMQLGVVDDIAVLAETDLKNKENIAERKSLYAQLQGQMEQLQGAIKDKDGTIETLERQLVQAGIKSKVMQAEMEITKKKESVKSKMDGEYLDTEAKQKVLQSAMLQNAELTKARAGDMLQNLKKDLESSKKSE